MENIINFVTDNKKILVLIMFVTCILMLNLKASKIKDAAERNEHLNKIGGVIVLLAIIIIIIV